ncbi:hypothetical protein ACQKMD_07895 [Viridibacillus sp. NPDC096237]|uniref:hypothetical protein n=1 Tax=Viridibacillus sp. NPDC096237 TaxID=3390721 RepID=UPI003CFCD7E9
MSKKIIILTGALLIFVLVGYYFLIVHSNITRHAEQMIEVKIPKGAVLVSKSDRHKQFKTNGEFYAEYHLKRKQIKKFKESIAEHDKWKPLPANEEFQQLVAKQNQYVLPTDEKKGNYYFNNNENDDSIQDIIKSKNYDFTVAVLNEQSGKLYILKKVR